MKLELEKEIQKSREISQQVETAEVRNMEAKEIIEGYVIQDENMKKEIQSLKENMAMYKEQLASAVQEKDVVNNNFEEVSAMLQHEKNHNRELLEKLSMLQNKLEQTSLSEVTAVGTPCSFEEFVAMKREIKLLKLEIMNMRESTSSGTGRGKTLVKSKDLQARPPLKNSTVGHKETKHKKGGDIGVSSTRSSGELLK